MITENQLDEAIAEMQGQRNPDANTCLKLASYYTIRNEMFPRKEPERTIDTRYSYAAAPEEKSYTIDYDGNTEFASAIRGRPVDEVMKILDDIVTGVYVVNPPLYKKIMRDLTE